MYANTFQSLVLKYNISYDWIIRKLNLESDEAERVISVRKLKCEHSYLQPFIRNLNAWYFLIYFQHLINILMLYSSIFMY